MMKQKTDSPTIDNKRSVLLLILFSSMLAFAYVVLAFFSTWGDWTDSYFHHGHPERLARDMIDNSHAAGMYAGMYIVLQQVVIIKYLKGVSKRIRMLTMLAMLIITFLIVNYYSSELLREVQDNIMHLPQLMKYPG